MRFATSPRSLASVGGSSGGEADADVLERLASVLAPDVLAKVLPHMPPFATSINATTIPPHVTVGLSGGVDSAVAAWLLHTAGYRVTGVLMRNWDEAEETGGQCSFEQDQRDARAAAKAVGIPLTVGAVHLLQLLNPVETHSA